MSLSIKKSFDETEKYWDITVSGEIDISNADEFRNELNAAYDEQPADLKVNLANLSYIDSTGLGVIIGIYGKIKDEGKKLSFTEPRENVKKLFRITNLDKVLLG